MVYSFVQEGPFCLPCALFATRKRERGSLVIRAHHDFKKMKEKGNAHNDLNYHKEAMEKAEIFIKLKNNPKATITSKLYTKRAENIEKNRRILKSVVRAIVHCGKQCIPLRGDSENFECKGNPGNFLEILKLVSEYDKDLDQHLTSPAMRNAKMTSHRIQNEVLEIVAQHYIVANLVREIKCAKFYSIQADEVTSHKQEILSLCIRFVDAESSIREEFLSFSKVPRITGAVLAAEIQNVLQSKGLQVENIRGQGYDGASNMSSSLSGVQGRIKQVSPSAVYVHCNSHVLNLVIARSCDLLAVKSMMDKLKAVCLFFYRAPKTERGIKSCLQGKVQRQTRHGKAQSLVGPVCYTMDSATRSVFTFLSLTHKPRARF